MKLSLRFSMALAVLLGFIAVSRADDLASIFTNVHARVAVPRRASIIFIQCHGLGFGDLSCYGQTNFETPNFDKLAAEGIRFNDYAPGGTNMAAAQAALLTGKISAPGEINAAQMLGHVGYRTGLYGEWVLGGQPWRQGFDTFAGFLNDDESRNYFSDHIQRYAPNSIFNPTNGTMGAYNGREMIYPNTNGKKGEYLPNLFFKAMLNFVRINQPDRFNHYRPFFLLVDFPAPRTATPGRDDFPVPSDAPYSGEPWPPAAKNRAALITQLDSGMGRLFEQLKKYGMTNNVAIFFSSSAPPEKFADKKLDFFRTPADLQATNRWRAPMIVWWPGHIPAGQVSDFHWSAADFLPTAAQMGFAKVPDKIDGRSILPVLLGKKMGGQP